MTRRHIALQVFDPDYRNIQRNRNRHSEDSGITFWQHILAEIFGEQAAQAVAIRAELRDINDSFHMAVIEHPAFDSVEEGHECPVVEVGWQKHGLYWKGDALQKFIQGMKPGDTAMNVPGFGAVREP